MAPAARILRTFVALPVCAEARAAMAAQARRLQRLDRGLRPVREENLHVTVAFLGPTPEDEVPRVVDALRGAVRGVAPIPVRYEGLGAFPDARRPRVVWAGLAEPPPGGRVPALARAVGEALRAQGYSIDVDRFHAHVTLGRLEPRSVSGLLRDAIAADPLRTAYGAESLSDLVLMLSEHESGGQRYRPLATLPLVACVGPEGPGTDGRPAVPSG